jgi:hypothetical protein
MMTGDEWMRLMIRVAQVTDLVCDVRWGEHWLRWSRSWNLLIFASNYAQKYAPRTQWVIEAEATESVQRSDDRFAIEELQDCCSRDNGGLVVGVHPPREWKVETCAKQRLWRSTKRGT